MAQVEIKIEMDVHGLLSRIDNLAAHVNGAEPGDSVADLAAQIGEIDIETDIVVSTRFHKGKVICEFAPAGNLARLLLAFDAERGVAQ